MPVTANEVENILNKLVKQGAKVEDSGRKQVRKLILPDRKVLFVHQTPSDRNWEWNLRRAVEKSGMVWPGTDKKATKESIKNYARRDNTTPDVPADFAPPTGPIKDVQVPPGVLELGDRRPIDRQIELVRGALHSLNNPPTFWTGEVTNLLTDQPGFRNGSGGNNAQGVLHWLGYRVVEARKNRRGHIYRWALDPTEDRVKKESLPIADLHPVTTAALESEPGQPGESGGDRAGLDGRDASKVPADAPAPQEPEEAPVQADTPAEQPEAVSEPREPVGAHLTLGEPEPVMSLETRNAVEAAQELERRTARGHFEAEKARLEREKEILRQSAVDDKHRAAEARRELGIAQQEIAQLRRELQERPVQAADPDTWTAIDFGPQRTWGEMQEWATSFGLDIEIKVRRAS